MALRALMVAPAMPARNGNGLAMRLSVFLEALQSIARTDLILVPVAGDVPVPAEEATPVLRVPLQPDTELTLLSRLTDEQFRLQSFVRYGKPTLAGQLSTSAWAELARNAPSEPYDIVHVSRAYLLEALRHIRGRSATTLDLDEDDLASFTSLASLERKRGNNFQAAWYDQEGKACDRLIDEAAEKIDLAFAASATDSQILRTRHPKLCVEFQPNAIDLQRQCPAIRRRMLLFVGTLAYEPNNEGLLWFLEYVLPRIRARSACQLVIIGRGPSAQLRAAVRRVRVLLLEGVDDLEPYYRSASAVIAPMRSGGGTRIKLLEAASYGIPSIATPAATAGLFSAALPWGWIAASPQQFANACLEALCDAKQSAVRASAGRHEVSRTFDRAKVVGRLARRFEELVDGRK